MDCFRKDCSCRGNCTSNVNHCGCAAVCPNRQAETEKEHTSSVEK